jgi:hypothetical protein
MNNDKLNHLNTSLRDALTIAFETFDQSGIGGVKFNGTDFEWCGDESGEVKTWMLSTYICETEISTWNYKKLAAGYASDYSWIVFERAEIFGAAGL